MPLNPLISARPLRLRRSAPRPRPRAVDALAALAGLGLGVTIALGALVESSAGLSAVGGAWTFAGRMSGLIGTYALLLTVLLAGRLPVLERAIGQDRLIAWHRRLAPAALLLIGAHGVATLLGYAQRAGSGVPAEAWTLLTTLPGVLTATVGFAALTAAAVTSYRRARRRLSHETWWAIHLYVYLGLALSFSHQLATGASFIGHPLARAFWIALWVGTAGAVLAYRVALPLWRSLRHRLRVAEVVAEGPGVVSVVLAGRRLERLPLSGGQFLHWRFLLRGLWWQAHPYSVSALPSEGRLRITVKDLGDHSRSLTCLRPGVRVAVEGPYGAFTADAAAGRPVLAIAAGVGSSPVRTLLEDLPAGSAPVVILRGSSHADLPLAGEIEAVAEQRGGTVHRLVGARDTIQLDREALRTLVPDLHRRDVFVCGPAGFARPVLAAARAAGVPRDRLHHETFDL